MAHIKSLTQLKAAGGVVSREPVTKELSWVHVNDSGEEVTDTFDVLIVKPSFGKVLSIGKIEDREQLALTISTYIMLENDKGKPELMGYDTAMQLDPSLAFLLLGAIREVSEPKNSRLPTNSSANSSPVESAVAPSLKLANG